MDSRAELTIGRDYCRGCKAASVQRYAGWATSDGHENSARPRAFYRQCTTCGTTRLVLGNVNDAEGLCRTVLRGWLERGGTGARMDGGRPSGDGSLDAEDALGFLTAEVWKLYLVWMPTLSGGSFLAYATALLPKRLAVWSREASGEPETRAKGRRFPKAHAASVSVSLDGLTTGDASADDESGERGERPNGAGFFKDGGSYDSFGAFTVDHAETGSSDVLRVLAAGGGGGARGDGGASGAASQGAAGARRSDRG